MLPLLEAGYTVRVMVRDSAGLDGRSWQERVEVVESRTGNPRCARRHLLIGERLGRRRQTTMTVVRSLDSHSRENACQRIDLT